MPKFSDTPPTDSRGYALPIIRTPAQKKLQAIITSPNMIGCNTHFWGGKTVPCEAPECPACKKGVPYRWHAYVSAITVPNMLHVIYETTALASETLVTYRKNHGNLRGCQVTAYRWRSAPNGRVIIRCEPCTQPVESLPNPPDLPSCLAIIWQLPLPALSTPPSPGPVPHVATSRQILNEYTFPVTGDPPDDAA